MSSAVPRPVSYEMASWRVSLVEACSRPYRLARAVSASWPVPQGDGDAPASLRRNRGVAGATQRDRKFIGTRQLFQVPQGELFEELWRGAVQ